MRRLFKPLLFASWACMATLSPPAFGQDTGAKASGKWEDASTWTGGAAPNSSNNVYIGSVYPVGAAGAATNATVTLGANQSASNVNVGYGAGTVGVLDLGGNKLTIGGNITVGSVYGGTGSITEAGGSFTAANLNMYTGSSSVTLGAADVVGGIDIENGAKLTTAATGNITGGGSVANGATLTLGADMNVGSGGINVEGSGATLHLAGHALSAHTLYLGYFLSSPVDFDRGSGTPGTLNLNTLDLGNGQNLALIAGDRIGGTGGDVNINTGATLTTASSANISSKSVNVVGGTLVLGDDLSIGNQTVNVEDGGTLKLAGHNLSASYLLLANSPGSSAVTLDRGTGMPGTLTLGNLFLGNGQALALIAGDTINNGSDGVNISGGATLTTASVTNITSNLVNVKTGGALNLGADLALDGTLNVQDSGSKFDAEGHAVTATRLLFGSGGTAPVTVSNLGAVAADQLLVGNGTALTLHGGDAIGSKIGLQGGSVLTVLESSNGTGLTLNGTSLSSLSIDSSSMDLIFTSPAPPAAEDWAFRWKDPSMGDWVGTLTTMIADHQIDLGLLPGQAYEVLDSNGYTYIYGIGGAAVPEPSSLVLTCLGAAGAASGLAYRRRRRGIKSRGMCRG